LLVKLAHPLQPPQKVLAVQPPLAAQPEAVVLSLLAFLAAAALQPLYLEAVEP
jgi:hypothetical protein